MPRKGVILSPESKAKQAVYEKKWKQEHMANLTITVRTELRDAYKNLATTRGKSLRALILDFLNEEYKKEFGREPR